MALDGEAAAQYMQVGKTNAPGGCLYTGWLAYGKPNSLGSKAGYTFPNAREAADYAVKRHYDRNPPRGASLWFGPRTPRGANDDDWNAGDWSIALGAGNVGATDQPYYGHIGQTTIAGREETTGRGFLFWSEDFLGNDINMPGFTPAEEDDMFTDNDRALLANVYNATFFGGKSTPDGKSVVTILAELQASVGALKATVQSLSVGVGDPKAVQAAAQAGAEAALKNARIVAGQ